MAYSIRLLEGGDATGEYKVWHGDSTQAQVVVSGTFDGATVGLSSSFEGEDITIFDGTSALAIDGTGAQMYLIKLIYGEQIRAVISGAGASTELNVTLYGVGD